uniref:Uncharacterized protein n=1 Tax=Anguilla anguilla TaxID=7936 RepID=A0A0E9WA73_ANGAN
MYGLCHGSYLTYYLRLV